MVLLSNNLLELVEKPALSDDVEESLMLWRIEGALTPKRREARVMAMATKRVRARRERRVLRRVATVVGSEVGV
jgi:hypothetical protein